jgi:hypothetical protein
MCAYGLRLATDRVDIEMSKYSALLALANRGMRSVLIMDTTVPLNMLGLLLKQYVQTVEGSAALLIEPKDNETRSRENSNSARIQIDRTTHDYVQG